MFARALTLAGILGALSAGPAAAAPSTARVSLEPDGSQRSNHSFDPAISADGNLIAYEVLKGDPRADTLRDDVYAYDRRTGATEWISAGPLGLPGDGRSQRPAVSADGRYVAFVSSSTNLVPGDTNGMLDVFVRDRRTGGLERITDPRPGGGSAYGVSLAPGGRLVAFTSLGPRANIGGDGRQDVLLHDRASGETEVVSAARDHTDSHDPSVSAGGRFVAFTFGSHVRVRDRAQGRTEKIPPGPGARDTEPAISASGRFVAFTSVPSTSDFRGSILVHDRETGKAEVASVARDGRRATGSGGPSISAGGRYVAFVSHAGNLVPRDTNGLADVFRRDRRTDTTRRVSVSTDRVQANGGSGDGEYFFSRSAISGRGSYVAFTSNAWNLVADDTNGAWDVFVRGPLAP